MVIILFIIFFALALFVRSKMPTWKGHLSEGLVSSRLADLPDEYLVFNDLLFESNGRSTQIDHVVVSPYGVFVIETKGYKGWILGGENSEYWTQVIYRSKHRFYNPIKQNDGHVKCLRHMLKCGVEIPFVSIVVFDNRAELKVHVSCHDVVNRSGLKEVIMRHQNRFLDADAIIKIARIIDENRIYPDNETKRQHRRNVKSRSHNSAVLIDSGICPHCGGKLVLRSGRYGRFYGCSNYPKCRFTMS